MVDVLHCVDLGIASHIVGNIIWIVCQKHVYAPNIPDSIKKIDELLTQWQKDEKTQHKYKGHITQERVRTSKDWPKLKSKGAPMHPMARFALELAEEHLSEEIILLASLLVEFYDLLDENGLFLSDVAKQDLRRIGSKLCRTYAKLAAKAATDRQKLWKATPKLHLFLHLCEWDSDMGNPRFFWCYADEDLVGQMIQAGESCHPRTLAIASMFKWLTVVFADQH